MQTRMKMEQAVWLLNDSSVRIRRLDEEEMNDTTNTTDDFYADPGEGDDSVTETGANEGSAIVDTLRVFGSIFLVLFCLFLCLRRKYPRYFNVRSWSPKIRCELASDQHGFIKWMWELYFTKDEIILEQCGMDALCFLRSLWFGVKLSLMGIVNAMYLMPIYATSNGAEDAPSRLAAVSTSYVPPESNRFYATVVASYILFLYAMFLILKEFKWYTKYRHKFLMQKKPRNYAAYVTGIPEEYRSSYALKEYFRQCFSKEGVIEAHVAMEIPDLERKVRQRKRVQANLEHALALERLKGITPIHQSVHISTGKVEERELVEVYGEQLGELNEEIRDAIRKIKFKNDRIQDTFQRNRATRSGLSLEEEEEEDEFTNMDWKAYGNMKLFPLNAPSDNDSPSGGIRRRRLSTINSIDSSPCSPFSVGSPTSPFSGNDSDASSLQDSIHDDIETGLRVDTGIEIEQDVTEDEDDLVLKRPTLSKEGDSSNFGIFQGQSEPSIIQQSEPSTRTVTPINVDADDPSAVFANAFFGWPLTPKDSNHMVVADSVTPSVDNDVVEIEKVIPETVESRSDEVDDGMTDLDLAQAASASSVTISATRATENEPFNFVADPATLHYNSHGEDTNQESSHSETVSQNLTSEQMNDPSDRTSPTESDNSRQSMRETQKLSHGMSHRASQAVKDGSGRVKKVVTGGSGHVKKAVKDGSQHALRASTYVVKEGSGKVKKVVSDSSGQVKNVVVSGSAQAKKVVISGSNQAKKVVVSGVKDGSHQVTKRVNPENLRKATDLGVKGVRKATDAGVSQIAKVTDMSVGNVKSFASYVLGSGDGTPLDAGFVVFSKLSTTHAALQMIHHPRPFVMDVQEAPMPDDIYWKNVGMPHKAKQTGKLISIGLSGLLCLFWTIPISFISSLTEVDSLRASVPFIDNMLIKAPWMEVILEQLAPLLLLCLNAFLPVLLRFISTFEGHIASSSLEASLFIKMAAFQIIQTFFVSAISGGVWAELSDILRNPEEIIDLLARSLPAQSTYFMQIVLVDTFVGLSAELLRMIPLSMAVARRCIGPNLTAKERNSVFLFLHPLSDPWEFQGAEIFGEAVLFFVVLFVYATIAPIMCFFLLFCWLLMGSAYRHQFFYNYSPNPDSGGKMWCSFIGICLICMLIAELTLVGLLALKRCPIQSLMMIPLIIMTVLFKFYIGMKHFYVTDHLPTRLCLQLDRKNHHNGGLDFNFVKQKYLQPALLEHEVHLGRDEQEHRSRGIDDAVSECSNATSASRRVSRAIRFRM